MAIPHIKINANGSPDTNFEYLNADGFSPTITVLKPVITIPDNTKVGYVSLPSISYNKYLGRYLAVFETNIGFYSAVSTDGINWADKKQIIAFKKPLSERTFGDEWISYPSLLSDSSENTDGTTNSSGNLYYGKGVWPNTSHQLTVMPFKFKEGGIKLFPK